jgi:tRNA/tmRNA/rRNA uracil-C5-methylase (TrmA/RlmC/RlmD family)
LPLSAASPDVIAAQGAMSWVRAMGLAACDAAIEFIAKHTAASTVVDPFCGVGTMLAVANHHGFNAIGVELSAKRARIAARLQLADISRGRVDRTAPA